MRSRLEFFFVSDRRGIIWIADFHNIFEIYQLFEQQFILMYKRVHYIVSLKTYRNLVGRVFAFMCSVISSSYRHWHTDTHGPNMYPSI